MREHLHAHVPLYPPDHPVRVVDKERQQCSPTSSRTKHIASPRYNRAPSPSPVPGDDEDIQVSGSSEGSVDSEAEELKPDHDGEDVGDFQVTL